MSDASGSTRNLKGQALLHEVLKSFGQAPSPRFRVIMDALVRHLHDFLQEVDLTEEEWFSAIRFLTRAGQISSDRRQEFILLSDTLGASMQVIGLNHPGSAGATESTVFGPFFVENAPWYENGDDLAHGAPGRPCYVSGTVRGLDGEAVSGALLDVWQADERGLYDVQQPELSEAQGRGRLYADDDGRFYFWSVRPEPYPIPHDGPVGEMLEAARRSPMRPAHIHFRIQSPGYRTLTTHVFAQGDPYIDSDAVFGVKDSLIADYQEHPPGRAPDGTAMNVPFVTLEYDFVLVPARKVDDDNGRDD